jgi:hypothetical protein
MTQVLYDFEAGVDNANVAVGGEILAVSASPLKYEAAAAFHGQSMGVEAIGSRWAEWDTPATDWSFSIYVRCIANPGTGSTRIMYFRTNDVTPADGGSVTFHSNGSIRITNTANSLIGAASAISWAPGDEFRLDGQVDRSGADTIVSLRIFKNANIDGTIHDDELIRTIPTSNIGSFRLGSSSTGTWQFQYDQMTLSDALEWIGPFVPAAPLDTPVVTNEDENDPSTPGGSDGTVTISWPDVLGATRYEVLVAAGHGATSGFTIVETDATSPYIITGRSAGDGTAGVRAIA